jgi:DNA-binding transcriptional ArsR family regulator
MKQEDAEKMVRHPVRVQIVAHLAKKNMSPSELESKIDATLGTVAYHVRAMVKSGALELVEEGRVRGAIEHFYKLRKSAVEPIKIELAKKAKEGAAAKKALGKL